MALVAVVDYATVIDIVSERSRRLQADLAAAMDRHVLSDVVVIFGLEEACEYRHASPDEGSDSQRHSCSGLEC